MEDQHDDRGPLMFNVTVTLLVVSAVTVALRCYVRICILRTFRSEDWTAVATMICFGFYCACVFWTIENGAGEHLVDIPFEDISEALKARWFGEIAYILTSVLLKFTVGIFLLRICSQRWQVAVIWTVLGVVLAFNIFYFFIALLQCLPVDYFWMRASLTSVPRGRCISQAMANGSTYAATAVNAFADWTLGLLPIALVWRLGLGRKTKISIAAVLALGIVASTATLVRIPYVWQLTHNGDFLYVFVDFLIWSTVENGLGLVASSIATLRPLYLRFIKPRGAGAGPGGLPDAEGPRPPSDMPYQYQYRYRRPRWSTRRSPQTGEFQCRGIPEEDEEQQQQQQQQQQVEKQPQPQPQLETWVEKVAEGREGDDVDVEAGIALPRRGPGHLRQLSLPLPVRTGAGAPWDSAGVDGMQQQQQQPLKRSQSQREAQLRSPMQAHVHTPHAHSARSSQQSTTDPAAGLLPPPHKTQQQQQQHRSSGWTWSTLDQHSPSLDGDEASSHHSYLAGTDSRRTSSRAQLVDGERRTW